MLLLNAEWQCQRCGEINELEVDPSGGIRQSLIEDCSVCCHPNVIDIVLEMDTDEFSLVFLDSRLE